jgi:transcriptional regulator with XRE-family HTH domain
MPGAGSKLRAIRLQAQLSFRQVEERSLVIVKRTGDERSQLSAHWLNRLEDEEHELTISKLVVLAEVYSMSAEQLLLLMYPQSAQRPVPELSEQPLALNLTTSLMGGAPGGQATRLLSENAEAYRRPEETVFLPAENGPLRGRYRRGIIGSRDCSLQPLVSPGSLVYIDSRNRAISSRRNWPHEFSRPMHFLMTRDGYVCCWCELDPDATRLTLIPHPLSPAPSRSWRYRKEVENLGRVVAAIFRQPAVTSE